MAWPGEISVQGPRAGGGLNQAVEINPLCCLIFTTTTVACLKDHAGKMSGPRNQSQASDSRSGSRPASTVPDENARDRPNTISGQSEHHSEAGSAASTVGRRAPPLPAVKGTLGGVGTSVSLLFLGNA